MVAKKAQRPSDDWERLPSAVLNIFGGPGELPPLRRKKRSDRK